MIEQIVAVADVESAGQVRLEPRQRQGCARCERGEGCGGGVLGKLVRDHRQGLALSDPGLALRGGELVVVGVPERAYLRAMLFTYLMPVLAMIATAAMVLVVRPQADAAAAAAGIAALLAAAAGATRVTRSSGLQPRILRRATATEIAACV